MVLLGVRMADEAENSIVLLDPESVDVARVSRHDFEDDTQRLVFTWHFEDVAEIGDVDVKLGVQPEPSLVFILGILAALGFPQQDQDYIEERYRRELA
jgi:hypothetical protein